MAIYRKFRKYSGKNRKRVTRKPTVKKAIRKARNTAFRKKVLSVISKVAENKHSATATATYAINDNPSAGQVIQILPNVTSGTGDNARVGDEIMAKSLKLKLILDHYPGPSINSNASTAYGIRVMIIQPRQFRGLTQIQANADAWLSNLLRYGGAKQSFVPGSPISMQLPINNEEFIVYHDKKYYEYFPYVYQSATAPTSFITPLEISKQGLRTMYLNIKCHNKKLKYDSSVNSGLTPDNFNPIMIIGVCNLNGVTQANSGLQLTYFSELTYEDV